MSAATFIAILFSWLQLSFGIQSTLKNNMQSSARSIYGAVPPIGYFDPLGLSEGLDQKVIKRYRESEVKHGRIPMIATAGFLACESFPLFGGKISGPASNYALHINEVLPGFWTFLLLMVGFIESRSVLMNWDSPGLVFSSKNGMSHLKDDYIPGDLDLDLSFRPFDDESLEEYQTKELQHGRLAMLAITGFICQELVDGKGIIEHFNTIIT